MRKWRTALNKRIGERIFLGAQRDYVTGELRQRSAVLTGTYVLAALVLATPWVVIAGGLVLAYFGFPHPLPLIIAAILVAVGWFLLPRRVKLPKGALAPADLPATFAMLHRVGDVLEAPRLTAVSVTEDFNAAVGTARGDRHFLVLGAVLWDSLTSQERIALIAHELAHLVNNDPTQGKFLGAALETLEGWYMMFLPSRVFDDPDWNDTTTGSNIIADLIGGTMRGLIGLVWGALERLSYLPQQRAEYLADALSAEVAGSEAPVDLLYHTAMAEAVRRKSLTFGGRNVPRGRDMVRDLAQATKEVGTEERARLTAKLKDTGHVIDASHPPTAFRIAFLETLPKMMPQVMAEDVDWAAIDAELAPHFARVGDRIAKRLVVQ